MPAPGSVRDGEWLIGIGMAAALRGNFTVKAQARVRWSADGRAMVETDMTDIGTGTYTILAQVAGEMLGPAGGRGRRAARRHRLPAERGVGRVVRRGQRGVGGGAGVRGYPRRTGAADERRARGTDA